MPVGECDKLEKIIHNVLDAKEKYKASVEFSERTNTTNNLVTKQY